MDKDNIMRGIETIPVYGLNVRQGGSNKAIKSMIKHEKCAAIVASSTFDEQAWNERNAAIRKQNKSNYDNIEFAVPAAIYKDYQPKANKSEFRTFINPTGNILINMGEGGALWVNDAAEVAQCSGRILTAKDMDADWIMVSDEYAAKWREQFTVMVNDFKLPFEQTDFNAAQSTGDPVEIYNQNLELLCICPSILAAGKVINKSVGAVYSALKYKYGIDGHYFRYYYDNNFTLRNNFPIEQLYNGEVINRFNTIKDAAEIMDIPNYTISMMIKNSGKYVDQYDCTWRKLKRE